MSENECEQSVPEVLIRAQIILFDEGDLLNRNGDLENYNIERRFSELSRQIGELTNIVLSVTERLFSNAREGNSLHTLSSEPNGRSDTYSPKNQSFTVSAISEAYQMLSEQTRLSFQIFSQSPATKLKVLYNRTQYQHPS